jgi:uncharacterized protein (TIRG00374 family)
VPLGCLLLGILALLLFLNYIGVNASLLILSRVNPIVIALLVMVELVGFVLYGTTWCLLIRSTGHQIRFSTCQMITFASVFVSFLTSSGFMLEVMRVILGSKEARMRMGQSAAAVILHRVVYVITVLASSVAAMFVLSVRGLMSHVETLHLELVSGGLIAIMIASVFLSLSPSVIQPLQLVTSRITRQIMTHVQRLQKDEVSWSVEQFFTDYENTFRQLLSSRRTMSFSFLVSSGDWSCSIILLWGVLAALGHVASIWIVIIAMAVGEIIQMIPIPVPGMIGIYETSLAATLITFGIPAPVSATAVILLRLITSIFDIPATGYATYRYGYRELQASLSLTF